MIFNRTNRIRPFIFPPSVRDWLPEEHIAFFISDTIDALDLRAFDERYDDEGPGNQAFDPRMMLKVLVYAYATGTFSSRKIAAKLHEDVAYRVLDQVKETTGWYPDRAVADAGYKSEANLLMLEEKGVEGFVAMGREKEEWEPEGAEANAPSRGGISRHTASPAFLALYRADS